MALTSIKLENFTTFRNLELEFSSGINIFIGENGTGKTHLMKAAYAAAALGNEHETSFAQKLIDVFIPHERRLGRLARRQNKSITSRILVRSDQARIGTSFSNHTKVAASATQVNKKWFGSSESSSIYIPVKEILANAPGFRSMYAKREVEFDATYDDILEQAYLPLLRGPKNKKHRDLLDRIETAITGKVIIKGEKFFLKNKHGELEFALLAEGWRKLGLIWQLVQNGALWSGSILFWDEPETNLNPKLIKTLIGVLLELQRQGVQIFIVTHDYTVLKWLELLAEHDDDIQFHSLWRNEQNEINFESAESFSRISKNSINDTFGEIFDVDVARSFEDVKI